MIKVRINISRLILLSLILIAMIIGASFQLVKPVRADTAQPTSVSIHDIAIYNSLIQTNDFLAVVPYTITYASTPANSIDKTFIFNLLGTDNVTLLGSATAYPYYNYGYGQGVVSFYFSASTAPAWGGTYNIQVIENPAYFSSPTYWVTPVAVSNYSPYTANQTANQALLQTKIITLAQQLTIAWSMTATPLTEQGGTGIILSSYGESYFRNSIPGLQSMCPALFLLSSTNLDYTGRSWDYSFTSTLYSTFNGTWIWDAMTGFAGLWGVPQSTATSFVIFILALVVMGLSIWTTQGQYIQAAFLDGTTFLIFGALGGWFSPLINVLLAFIFVLVGGWILILNRA